MFSNLKIRIVFYKRPIGFLTDFDQSDTCTDFDQSDSCTDFQKRLKLIAQIITNGIEVEKDFVINRQTWKEIQIKSKSIT